MPVETSPCRTIRIIDVETTTKQRENFAEASRLIDEIVGKVANHRDFSHFIYTIQPDLEREYDPLNRRLVWLKPGELLSGQASVCTGLDYKVDDLVGVEVKSALYDNRGEVPLLREKKYVDGSWSVSQLRGKGGLEVRDAFRDSVSKGLEEALYDVFDLEMLADTDATHFEPIKPKAA